ncbi:hypothetical protein L3Q82_003041 [Scortum barcoo]|uniref:Uncharacterized protein n=1 Tax=Scortum barcoo TaxID=214431 RepID=A0ACB8VQX3_9TELE|nr:hypothetical protein L3Q82_003041 [Scortum barcoo]
MDKGKILTKEHAFPCQTKRFFGFPARCKANWVRTSHSLSAPAAACKALQRCTSSAIAVQCGITGKQRLVLIHHNPPAITERAADWDSVSLLSLPGANFQNDFMAAECPNCGELVSFAAGLLFRPELYQGTGKLSRCLGSPGDVCFPGSLITVWSAGHKTSILVLSREKVAPAVNMLTTVFLSALLMLGGLRGAVVSDLQVYGKSIHSDKTLLSSDNGRQVKKQPHQQQTKSEIRRSLDVDSFNIHVTPTASKISLPTIIKLYPPTAKPLHLHANMPMRFGRDSNNDERTPNMPQRFGRSWEVIKVCGECHGVQEAQNKLLPQKFGKNSLYWNVFRTLANAQLLDTLHW